MNGVIYMTLYCCAIVLNDGKRHTFHMKFGVRTRSTAVRLEEGEVTETQG